MAIDPTGPGLKAFVEADPEGPVVMLNLLRFLPGGEAGYDDYLRHFGPTSAAHGAEVVYYGRGDTALVAEDGQAWDAVLLVRYPSRRAFSEMVRDPEYQTGSHLRSDVLVEAVLQPTIERGRR